eukprot:augustus_masked-scaffold_38-processed-gene-0.51-mRNA-1 protein AED:1.00 eAED:1.00 QI:0/-1/0/0/-1/1/1/0/258
MPNSFYTGGKAALGVLLFCLGALALSASTKAAHNERQQNNPPDGSEQTAQVICPDDYPALVGEKTCARIDCDVVDLSSSELSECEYKLGTKEYDLNAGFFRKECDSCEPIQSQELNYKGILVSQANGEEIFRERRLRKSCPTQYPEEINDSPLTCSIECPMTNSTSCDFVIKGLEIFRPDLDAIVKVFCDECFVDDRVLPLYKRGALDCPENTVLDDNNFCSKKCLQVNEQCKERLLGVSVSIEGSTQISSCSHCIEF